MARLKAQLEAATASKETQEQQWQRLDAKDDSGMAAPVRKKQRVGLDETRLHLDILAGSLLKVLRQASPTPYTTHDVSSCLVRILDHFTEARGATRLTRLCPVFRETIPLWRVNAFLIEAQTADGAVEAQVECLYLLLAFLTNRAVDSLKQSVQDQKMETSGHGKHGKEKVAVPASKASPSTMSWTPLARKSVSVSLLRPLSPCDGIDDEDGDGIRISCSVDEHEEDSIPEDDEGVVAVAADGRDACAPGDSITQGEEASVASASSRPWFRDANGRFVPSPMGSSGTKPRYPPPPADSVEKRVYEYVTQT